MDISDESSDALSTIFESQDPSLNEITSGNELVEDLTNGVDTKASSDGESVTELQDGQVKGEALVVKPRSYQLEMLEESLRRNIIVAMDTGSGKTHIAVLRILHELERMAPHQLIWFLAPTISLCSQQFEYLESQITSVQIKFLSGNDGVDRWNGKSLWNAVLQNVKVVVSTYQILQDALSHGFVDMKKLALVVFDEAHNCVGNFPGAKIMHNFYRRQKSEAQDVPHILGLTASPVMRSDPSSLNMIEETLNAICRTPTRHRSELRLQVKLPVFSQVYFDCPSNTNLAGCTKSISSLGRALASLNIMEDPYVLALIEENSERSQRQLDKVRLNHKTWTHSQIKKFYTTSLTIYAELGAWAADYYIIKVIGNVAKLVQDDDDRFLGLWDVTGSEKQYLANALSKVEIMETSTFVTAAMPLISDKVVRLLETLAKESKDFRGIVFVEQRVTAEVLATLLRSHPHAKDQFKIGTMVGTSANAARTRNVAEIVDIDSQKHVLSRFRSGEVNLVVATSVLEEGIDVPACNVVICFQKPANLKSFVQRRGRARQRESKLILFIETAKDVRGLTDFQKLEEEMKKIYEDEMRALAELVALEDSEEDGRRSFRVAGTGALLDLDNAVSHLYHFCATLPAKEYVDLRPDFICHKDGDLVRAKVILPLAVNGSVRTAESLTAWKSEKNAIKDVSFQAYVALYKAGLVSENLLPLMRHDGEAEDLMSSTIEKRAAIVEINEQLNPWIAVSEAWCRTSEVWRSSLAVGDLEIDIFLPFKLPIVRPFHLYWDLQTEIPVIIGTADQNPTKQSLNKAIRDAHIILDSAFGRRFPSCQQHQVMPFGPRIDIGRYASMAPKILDRPDSNTFDFLTAGLIHDTLDKNIGYMYKRYLPSKPHIQNVQQPYLGYLESHNSEPHLSVKRLPKRNDFLHKVVPGFDQSSTKEHIVVLPLSRCEIDSLPFRYVRFALFIPSIMHRFGVYFLAQELSTTLLKDVQISNLELVITAICASSAQEPTNYQRLEFLGDSILKLCTSIQLMAEYPLWHEGLLSSKKDRVVSNGRLARASTEAGLDKFIVAKRFKSNKWRPLYVHELANQPVSTDRRKMSSKVLADVVEALIGAATIDGGIPKALKCLSILLPELNWKSLASRQIFLHQRVPTIPFPPILEPVERLLGYTFKKKSLLIEALTHASFISSSSGSLERLEYLGDAILDNIIVTEMWNHNLTHVKMHTLRTAMVNADFLAWLCLESSIEVETSKITRHLQTESKIERWPLWRFLRHSSYSLSKAQHQTARRHLVLRDQINKAIEEGTNYPWDLLSRLDAMKFFSDVIESLIGAVWIDSYGTKSAHSNASNGEEGGELKREPTLDTCKHILENLGVMRYMRRILKDGVHILHPKEELGMLADEKTVKYVLESRKFGVDGAKNGERIEEEGEDSDGLLGEGATEYLCTIFVGDKEIVRVEGGVSKVEVKTRAATEAVRLMKGGNKEKGRGNEGGGDKKCPSRWE